MKKQTAKKNLTATKRTNSRVKVAQPHQTSVTTPSVSIYVYLVIILFFIAAAFFCLGMEFGNNKSQNVVTPNAEVTQSADGVNNVEISEEALLQPMDYYTNARDKLVDGDIAGAIADLTTAIDAGGATSDMYTLRGEAYMQLSDYRNALADFNTALETDAVSAVAYYDRALLNMRLEDYSTALADINNALAAQASKPSSALQMRDLYAKRGQLNLWLKNWQGAVADFTNSLARPEGTVDATVYADRAEAYTQMGSYADAINDYAAAIRIISEQIQGTTTQAARESLSSNAMGYFEKSAALNLALGNLSAAYSDLDSAYAIASALGDDASISRIQNLQADLNQQ